MTTPAALLPLLLVAATCAAADWPQFLGPTRDNHAAADEPALPDHFDADPAVLWQHDLGSGNAGPAVAGGKVVIAHRQGGEVVVEALEAASGKALWTYRYTTDYRDSFGMDDGPRAVPAISDGTVIVHGADGQIHALALSDGALKWKVDSVATWQSAQGFFGRACAPLVADGKVIVTVGGTKAVAALDLKDGQTVWATGEDEASYSSPVLAGPDLLLCWLRNDLTTLSLKDGHILAHERHRPAIEASVSAATPLKTTRGWFVSAEYDVGASLWEVSEQGALKKSWSADHALSCHYATPVAVKDRVFGFDGRQERGQTLRCYDLASNKVIWNSPRAHGGSLLLVGDKLLAVTEDGELWIVRATGDTFDRLLSAQILRAGHRSAPAYANGILYVRDGERLVAVNLGK